MIDWRDWTSKCAAAWQVIWIFVILLKLQHVLVLRIVLVFCQQGAQ